MAACSSAAQTADTPQVGSAAQTADTPQVGSATQAGTDTSASKRKSRLTVVFNYDGGGNLIRDAVLAPATKTMSFNRTFDLAKQNELVRVDTTTNDCSPNKNFKAAVVQMPKNGSLMANVVKVNSNYPPGSPREHCNGTSHQELLIYDTPNKAGDDVVILKVPTGNDVVDMTINLQIR